MSSEDTLVPPSQGSETAPEAPGDRPVKPEAAQAGPDEPVSAAPAKPESIAESGQTASARGQAPPDAAQPTLGGESVEETEATGKEKTEGSEEPEERVDATDEDDNLEGPRSRNEAKQRLTGNTADFLEAVGIDQSIGKQLNQVQAVLEKPDFTKLRPEATRKPRAVFVQPHSFSSVHRVQTEEPRRLVLIHGLEHAGKRTCALNWSVAAEIEVQISTRLHLYRRSPHSEMSLLLAVDHKEWPKNSTVILEDAFDKGLSIRDLEPGDLEQLEAQLKDKSSFLILTTELDEDSLAAVAAPRFAASPVDLLEVLKSHLSFYRQPENGALREELATRALESWPALCSHLDKPVLIDDFCRRLLGEISADANFELIAQEVSLRGQTHLESWFGSRNHNEQLLAMLTLLFLGLDRPQLLELYRQAIYRLRGEGFLWAKDPRAIGDYDALEAVRIPLESAGVQFEDTTVLREVARQCGSRQLLLWSILLPWVEELVRIEAWTDPYMRSFLAVALGRLGIHDQPRLVRAVESLGLARSEHGWARGSSVASLAGYALAEALRRDPTNQRNLVPVLLRGWIESLHPDLMWTAGAAIWRVYAGAGSSPGLLDEDVALRRELLRLLRRLVIVPRTKRFSQARLQEAQQGGGEPKEVRQRAGKRRWETGRDLRFCAAFALERIARIDPEAAVQLILEWVAQGRKSVLHDVAILTVGWLFENLLEQRVRPDLAEARALLNLIGPVLRAAGASSRAGAMLMLCLRSWLRWKEWREEIFKELLAVANLGNTRTRENLRSALARYWMADAEPEALRIAQAVLARAYVMDGLLIDQPNFGRGVLIVDPDLFTELAPPEASQEQLQHFAARLFQRRGAAWHLLGLLEAQLEVTITRFGRNSFTEMGGEGASGVKLESNTVSHRLVIPSLERARVPSPRLLVILTAGTIADLDDALDGRWAEEVLVISAGPQLPSMEGADVLNVGRDLGADDVRAIESRFEARWARNLALAPASTWREVIESFELKVKEPPGLEELLLSEVQGLKEIESARGRDDRARAILCAILWCAALDLPAAIGILERWLELPANGETEVELCRAMGAAGARALLRIHSALLPPPAPEAPRELFKGLADALASFSRDGADAVLGGVERWLEDPELAGFFAGDVIDGRGRLLRWAEKHVPDQAAAIAAALEKLRQAASPANEDLALVGETLDAAVDRLDRRLALGPRLTLPPLADGERYGLIVLDAVMSDRRLAQLASALTTRLTKAEGREIKPAVFRLGDRHPAWVPGTTEPSADALADPEAKLPPLLSAVLNSGLTVQDVAFVLTLSLAPLLDEEDWIGTPWYDRLYSYRPQWAAGWPSQLLAVPTFDGPSEVELIVTHLMEQDTARLRAGLLQPPAVAATPGP